MESKQAWPAGTLPAMGYRLVIRGRALQWAHPLEVKEQDIDTTDMDDAAFERAVREAGLV